MSNKKRLGMSLVTSVLLAAVAHAAPRLEMNPPTWDFGEVWYGTPLTTDVELKNTGDDVLVIEKVQKSCGCTAATPSKTRLAPGESTQMRVGYDSTKNTRNVRQTVRVITNDPQRRQSVLMIQGQVNPLFEYEPMNRPMIMFGSLTPSSAETKSLKIRVSDQFAKTHDGKVSLKLPEIEIPGVELDLKTIKEGEAYELTATTKPPLSGTSLSRQVELETNLDFAKKLKVRIQGFVRPKVRVSPPRIFISPKLTRPSERQVSVVFEKDEPIKVEAVTSDHPDVKGEVVSTNNQTAGQYGYIRLAVTVPAGQDLEPGKPVMVRIKTDAKDPQYQVIEIPVQTMPVRQGYRRITPDRSKAATEAAGS